MNEQNTIFLRVNEVKFDKRDKTFIKTNCFVTIAYQPDRKYVEDVTVTSTLFNVKKSKRNWTDMADKYHCDLEIPNLATLSKIADSIKDLEWEYEDTEKPLADESIKQDVLNILYNARELFADFILKRLASGEYKHITKEGWVNLWKFKTRVEKDYNIQIPLVYLCDLPNYDNRFGVSGDSRVKRCINLHTKFKTIYFRINTVFDTAPCTVYITYQPERGYIKGVWVVSSLSEVEQSKMEWLDMTSYGQCELVISSLAVIAEIAECIKEEEWMFNEKSIYNPSMPLTDENVKEEILNILFNASRNFADFVYNQLKDKTDWVKLWKFQREMEEEYELDLPIGYLFQLPDADSRFQIKGNKFDSAVIRTI